MTAAKSLPLRRIEARVSGAPNVMPKDVVYFHNEVHGPLSGAVTAVGRDGCRIHHPAHGEFQVLWEHVLGHKTRAQRDLVLLEQGEDGAIGYDPGDEKRVYIRGGVPTADPEAGAEAVSGELIKAQTGQIMDYFGVGGGEALATAVSQFAGAWSEHLRLQAQRAEEADIRREAADFEIRKAFGDSQQALVAQVAQLVAALTPKAPTPEN